MNLALRLFAGVIDLLQFIFFITLLAFQFITPVGGGVSGAAAGAYLCYNASSGVLMGLWEAAKCAAGGGILGAGLSAFAIPVGIIIDIALSCTFGVLLMLLLWVTGRFSLMAVAMGFGAEALPGINAFVPGWSLLVHNCIKNYKQKQASGGTSRTKLMSALDVASMIPGVGAALSAAKPAVSMATRATSAVQPAPNRIPLQTKNFDGIKPANDNRRHSYAQAA